MANVNKPMGLVPIKHLSGAPYTGAGRVYCILSTDGNAFAPGDPVVRTNNADANGIPAVTLATAGTGNPLVGAMVSAGGIKYGSYFADPTNLNTVVIPATKTQNYYIFVADDPSIIFEIQEVSGGTQLAAAQVGNNANLSSGTNNGYVSGWQLANAGVAVTSTLQMKLLQLRPSSDNAFGAYAKWWTVINNHQYNAGVAGI